MLWINYNDHSFSCSQPAMMQNLGFSISLLTTHCKQLYFDFQVNMRTTFLTSQDSLNLDI